LVKKLQIASRLRAKHQNRTTPRQSFLIAIPFSFPIPSHFLLFKPFCESITSKLGQSLFVLSKFFPIEDAILYISLHYPSLYQFIFLSNLANKSFHLYIVIHYTETGVASLACLYPFLKGLFEKYQDKVAPLCCVCTQYSRIPKTGALLFLPI